MCLDNEEWYKDWRGSELLFQNWHELHELWPEHSKSLKKNCFNWLLVTKVYIYIVWATKLQWSYVSWQWRMIQKLKRYWLVVLKLTWTSQILTWALEKSTFFFCFNWLLVTKVYFVRATKVQRSYLSLQWGVKQILKKDWPVVWKKT